VVQRIDELNGIPVYIIIDRRNVPFWIADRLDLIKGRLVGERRCCANGIRRSKQVAFRVIRHRRNSTIGVCDSSRQTIGVALRCCHLTEWIPLRDDLTQGIEREKGYISS